MCDDIDWKKIALIGSLVDELNEGEKRRGEMTMETQEECPDDCEEQNTNTDDLPDEDPYP